MTSVLEAARCEFRHRSAWALAVAFALLAANILVWEGSASRIGWFLEDPNSSLIPSAIILLLLIASSCGLFGLYAFIMAIQELDSSKFRASTVWMQTAFLFHLLFLGVGLYQSAVNKLHLYDLYLWVLLGLNAALYESIGLLSLYYGKVAP
jgi:hypothetical protein